MMYATVKDYVTGKKIQFNVNKYVASWPSEEGGSNVEIDGQLKIHCKEDVEVIFYNVTEIYTDKK